MATGGDVMGDGSGSLADSGARGGGQGMPECQGGTGAADLGAGPQGVVPGGIIRRLGGTSMVARTGAAAADGRKSGGGAAADASEASATDLRGAGWSGAQQRQDSGACWPLYSNSGEGRSSLRRMGGGVDVDGDGRGGSGSTHGCGCEPSPADATPTRGVGAPHAEEEVRAYFARGGAVDA